MKIDTTAHQTKVVDQEGQMANRFKAVRLASGETFTAEEIRREAIERIVYEVRRAESATDAIEAVENVLELSDADHASEIQESREDGPIDTVAVLRKYFPKY